MVGVSKILHGGHFEVKRRHESNGAEGSADISYPFRKSLPIKWVFQLQFMFRLLIFAERIAFFFESLSVSSYISRLQYHEIRQCLIQTKR